jgi:hypothetical protein
VTSNVDFFLEANVSKDKALAKKKVRHGSAPGSPPPKPGELQRAADEICEEIDRLLCKVQELEAEKTQKQLCIDNLRGQLLRLESPQLTELVATLRQRDEFTRLVDYPAPITLGELRVLLDACSPTSP